MHSVVKAATALEASYTTAYKERVALNNLQLAVVALVTALTALEVMLKLTAVARQCQCTA
jgi:hypothetical protein